MVQTDVQVAPRVFFTLHTVVDLQSTKMISQYNQALQNWKASQLDMVAELEALPLSKWSVQRGTSSIRKTLNLHNSTLLRRWKLPGAKIISATRHIFCWKGRSWRIVRTHFMNKLRKCIGWCVGINGCSKRLMCTEHCVVQLGRSCKRYSKHFQKSTPKPNQSGYPNLGARRWRENENHDST